MDKSHKQTARYQMCSYKSWDEFHEQIQVAFKDPNKKDATQQKLEQPKQGMMLATEFFIDFEECKAPLDRTMMARSHY